MEAAALGLAELLPATPSAAALATLSRLPTGAVRTLWLETGVEGPMAARVVQMIVSLVTTQAIARLSGERVDDLRFKWHHCMAPIDCLKFPTAQAVYEHALNNWLGHNPTARQGFANAFTCRDFATFVALLSDDDIYQRICKASLPHPGLPLYLIITEVHHTLQPDTCKHGKYFVPNLLDLHSQTGRNVVVIIVSQAALSDFVVDEASGGVPLPVALYLPNLSEEQLLDLVMDDLKLVHLTPEETERLRGVDKEELYAQLARQKLGLKWLLNSSASVAEIREFIYHGFGNYIRPLLQGQAMASDAGQLHVWHEKYIKAKLDQLSVKSDVGVADMPLTVESRLVLVASYVCSFNPKYLDQAAAEVKRKKTKRSAKATAEVHASTDKPGLEAQVIPHAFALSKLLGVYDNLANTQVTPSQLATCPGPPARQLADLRHIAQAGRAYTALLLPQISHLVAIGLLTATQASKASAPSDLSRLALRVNFDKQFLLSVASSIGISFGAISKLLSSI